MNSTTVRSSKQYWILIFLLLFFTFIVGDLLIQRDWSKMVSSPTEWLKVGFWLLLFIILADRILYYIKHQFDEVEIQDDYLYVRIFNSPWGFDLWQRSNGAFPWDAIANIKERTVQRISFKTQDGLENLLNTTYLDITTRDGDIYTYDITCFHTKVLDGPTTSTGVAKALKRAQKGRYLKPYSPSQRPISQERKQKNEQEKWRRRYTRK